MRHENNTGFPNPEKQLREERERDERRRAMAARRSNRAYGRLDMGDWTDGRLAAPLLVPRVGRPPKDETR